ncbi:hypothetical protein VNO80_02828 [Phaseolus coccineus]|uniref:Uncharacterized protein n=1 Tax=Phaseolus coccineus TaxID=3886 RepID=A0AAN9RMP2_PHACN
MNKEEQCHDLLFDVGRFVVAASLLLSSPSRGVLFVVAPSSSQLYVLKDFGPWINYWSMKDVEISRMDDMNPNVVDSIHTLRIVWVP